MNRRSKQCNNCGCEGHFWVGCDQEFNKDRKKEHTKMAHMVSSKNNGYARMEKFQSREEMKANGQNISVPFILKMMDLKTSQLELVMESYEDLGHLELDETGKCQKKTDVMELKNILDRAKPDVAACIQNAKGRAKCWINRLDNSPLCDWEIFTMKLGALIDVRDLLSQKICIAARFIDQAEADAILFFEHRESFGKLEIELASGLESKEGIASKIARMTEKLKRLREVTSLLDSDCKRIKKRGLRCQDFEDFLRTADSSVLKFENKLLLLQVDRLKMDVESRNILCHICFDHDIDMRLVTHEGNCTHCICSHCVMELDWNYDNWWDTVEYQKCPFCRERINQEACLKLTFA